MPARYVVNVETPNGGAGPLIEPVSLVEPDAAPPPETVAVLVVSAEVVGSSTVTSITIFRVSSGPAGPKKLKKKSGNEHCSGTVEHAKPPKSLPGERE